MKITYLANRPFLKFYYVAAFLFFATIITIYSCRKDNGSPAQTINDPVINQAKTWYEQTYAQPSTFTINRSVMRSSSPGLPTGSVFNYSQFIKPDWQHGASYKRYNARVVELPIDPASSKIGTGLSNFPNGSTVYNPKYSRSSFLILNDSTGYHAYVMTIIADSAYINNNLSKLDLNKYNNRDADFSGIVIYSTPNGNYVNGWIYKNGNITMALPPGQKQNTQAAVTANSAISTPAATTRRFVNNTRLLEIETCYTWYQTVSVNGVDYGTTVLDETCSTSYIGDWGGSSGSSTGGSTGTSGGSGGSSTAPANPCTVPSGSSNVVSVSSNHSINRVVQQIDQPIDGSGFPAPATTSPCPTETVTTTVTPVKTDTIGSLMRNPNSLTAAQKAQIQPILNQILNDCIGKAIVNYLTGNGDKFDFSVNSGLAAPAAYNPATNSIQINNPATLNSDNLEEELFHAYQNFNIPGGTAKYAGTAGDANIEFEAKVLHDMHTSIYGGPWFGPTNTAGYQAWINSLTNFSSFPTSFTATQRSYYFLYMADFIQQTPGYTNDIINYSLNPTAMFNLINSSPCSNQ